MNSPFGGNKDIHTYIQRPLQPGSSRFSCGVSFTRSQERLLQLVASFGEIVHNILALVPHRYVERVFTTSSTCLCVCLH